MSYPTQEACKMLKVDERYLTLREVAETLKVSRRTVYRWIKDEDLNAYKFANEYRITESDLKDFLGRRRTRPERG
ncbi:MAG TPA: helix-turn-helix domain-containing protein [Rubrobacteraceae bacterium]|jgi:excisionase family DNA binding protein|nr:helix-turn-helix domain-containing protein [Rubrobacteraceae bacterium]